MNIEGPHTDTGTNHESALRQSAAETTSRSGDVLADRKGLELVFDHQGADTLDESLIDHLSGEQREGAEVLLVVDVVV